MSRELIKEIISNPNGFINEIINNHGIDSMQYVMAVNAVREVEFKLSQMKERTA